MPVQQFASKAEFESCIKSGKLVVVDFNATWCGPCKQIKPVFENMSNQPEFEGTVFASVDVDEQTEISDQEGIQAMPTFKVYRDGKVLKEIVGASAGALEAAIKDLHQA